MPSRPVRSPSTPQPRRRSQGAFPRALSLTSSLALVLALAPLTAGPADANWPHQRGPGQDGIARGTGSPPAGGFGLELAWKRALGSGYGEVAVVDGLAVATFTDGTDDLVAALDSATGAERWRYRIGPMYAGHDGSDDGPIGTPTIADGIVYGINPHGRFFAVRLADGKEVWARTLDAQSEAQSPVYGFATVPVVVGDAVVLLTGRPEGGRAITAYRKSDGTPLWSRGDDTVSYQSPIVAEVDGRRQLVAATNHLLLGLDPATGEVIWQHRHTAERGDGFAQPLALGQNRFLLTFFQETAAFEVARNGEGYAVKELWRTNGLRNTYTQPVLRDGYLYGFSGNFMTCIKADTGEVAWKSRPPGGSGVILVGDHLVVVGSEGEAVVVEASPKGYAEKARVKVFERPGLTPASFAGGRVFVRNLQEIASLRLTKAAPLQAAASPPTSLDLSGIGGELGESLRRIAAADGAARPRLVDAFLANHPEMPIREADGSVHFLYRGEAKDVSVLGPLMPDGEELVLSRVPGTDLHVGSVSLDPEGHWEYALRVDLGDPQPDPANPYQIPTPFGAVSSELRMPGWRVPHHIDEPAAGRPRGRLEQVTFKSEIRGNERPIQVYLPPGYEAGSRRYPVFYVNSGDQALTAGKLGNTLDNLIGESVAPVIAVLLPRRQPEFNGPDRAAYARMVVEEVVPFIDRTYRTVASPEGRGIGGVGSAGFSSVLTAFSHPGVFGKVSVQSFYMPNGTAEEVIAAVSKPGNRPLTVFVEASRNDYLLPQAQLDARSDTQRLIDALKAGGHSPVVHATAGAPGWGHWRAQSDAILTTLFPKAAGG